MKKTIFFVAFASIFFAGCLGQSNTKEEWTAFIYPDKANEKRSKTFGKFETLKQCQDASKNELEKLGLTSRGLYKCGLNCSYHEGMKVEICEQMSK